MQWLKSHYDLTYELDLFRLIHTFLFLILKLVFYEMAGKICFCFVFFPVFIHEMVTLL